MTVYRKLLIGLTALIFLCISYYTLFFSKNIEFENENVAVKANWALFIIWSFSLIALGFFYNKMKTADTQLLIITLIILSFSWWQFTGLSNPFFSYGKGPEKVLYIKKPNSRNKIVQCQFLSGAIGGDYYDTIISYQLFDGIRFVKPFNNVKFDSTEWLKQQ